MSVMGFVRSPMAATGVRFGSVATPLIPSVGTPIGWWLNDRIGGEISHLASCGDRPLSLHTSRSSRRAKLPELAHNLEYRVPGRGMVHVHSIGCSVIAAGMLLLTDPAPVV